MALWLLWLAPAVDMKPICVIQNVQKTPQYMPYLLKASTLQFLHWKPPPKVSTCVHFSIKYSLLITKGIFVSSAACVLITCSEDSSNPGQYVHVVQRVGACV